MLTMYISIMVIFNIVILQHDYIIYLILQYVYIIHQVYFKILLYIIIISYILKINPEFTIL